MSIDPNWIAQNFPVLSGVTPLGRGGQKWVFGAKHPTEGDVVLKIIKPSADAEEVRREFIAVQKVKSPRVPVIFEVGIVGSQLGPCFWFREARVLGESVRQVVQRGPLQPHEVLRLGLHTLEALGAASGAQVVHRDVKPDNVMRDGSGQFWLLDFGIARHLDLDSLTADNQRFGKGTFGYSAPEQMRNRKTEIDERADLFALGVTLFECATGRNPFLDGARDANERLRRTEHEMLPPVTLAIGTQGAREFADLVAVMTQKRRDQRPRTVAEALEWMRAICNGEGVA